ncbi:hypothetical protein NADFUDRAFT_47860 [Nadsonia fulvescens var. elongata DSM 6958]|uniref:Uncharacterized protein n=1 Tax=Nadsonia fulvescens var. elongata DSM 6958 TaxID=857566 RepID=A0A1E3PDD8_9ASCO|nr:hypothetical protein NADFUDRAFT_47860 [Nadsonia fulvescens var. elongata DSM 6958]
MSSFLVTFKEEGLVSSSLTTSGTSGRGNDCVNVSNLQLSTPEIELPDGTRVSSRIKNSSNRPDEEEEYYYNHVATSGSIFTRSSTASKAASFPRSIAYRLLESAKVLELSPTDLVTTQENSAKEGMVLQKIRVRLSDSVLPHCITLSESDNDELLIDAISQGGIIFNFAFKFSSFVTKSEGNLEQGISTLNDLDFLRWGNIQNPFGFSVLKHKNPYQMYAVSCDTLVVAFQDGSLVKLARELTLGHLTASDFETSSYNVSLSSLLSWKRTFGIRKTSTAFPDISTDAVLSLVHVPGTKYLITLSVNRTLKLWSLDTLIALWEHVIPGPDNQNPQGLLTTEPLPLLRLSSQSSKASKSENYYLSTFLPISNGLFKLWQVNPTASSPALVITDLGQCMEMTPSPPDQFSVWLISNYFMLEYDEFLEFWVLWKSDVSSLVQHVKVQKSLNSLKNLQWQTTLCKETDQLEDLELLRSPLSSLPLNSSSQLDFYAKRIFRVGRFSEQILLTALRILQKHSGVSIKKPKRKNISSNVTLQNEIYKFVNSSVAANTIAQIDSGNYGDSSHSEIVLKWVRFERLCMELQKQSNEVLSMNVDSESGLVTVIKGANISILRPLSDLEIIFYNKIASLSKTSLTILDNSITIDSEKGHRTSHLLYCLDSYFKCLSHQVTFDLAKILHDDCTQEQHISLNERGHTILETAFGSQFSECAVNDLAQSLKELGSLDELFELIYELLVSTPEVDRNGFININGASFLNQALYSNITVSYKIILQSIVLLLLINDDPGAFVSQDYIQYLAKFLNLFKSFTIIIKTLHALVSVNNNQDDTSSEYPSQFVSQKVSFIENLIVDSLVAPAFSRDNVKEILQGLICSINTSVLPMAITELVSNLVLRDIDQAIKFSPYLTSSPFDTFIKGFVLLYAGGEDEGDDNDQVSHYFKKAAIGFVSGMIDDDFIIARTLKRISPMACKNSLKQLLESVSSRKDKPAFAPYEYFLYLTELFKYKQCFRRAFEYCKLAADRISDKEQDSHMAIQIYQQLYELALKNGDYDQAYNAAVVELASDTVKSQAAIENLIVDMCENGYSSKLIKYQFKDQHHTVDKILLKLAQQALGANGEIDQPRYQQNSVDKRGDKKLLYFQILYAWRLEHGDYRGAATALYLEINYLRSSTLSIPSLSSLTIRSKCAKITPASDVELSNNVRITEIYLILMNILRCMPVDEAWILVQQVATDKKESSGSNNDNTIDTKRHKSHRDNANNGFRTKRVVLSFDAIQAEYNSWLYRIEQALNVKVKFLAQEAENSVQMQSIS